MVQYGRPSRVPLERKLYGHPLAGLLWERQFGKVLLEHDLATVGIWEWPLVHRAKGPLKFVKVDNLNWRERNRFLIRCGKYSVEKLIWENPHQPLTMFTWVALKDNVKQVWILSNIAELCSTPEFPQGVTEKLPSLETPKISAWSYDMEGHAKKVCGTLLWISEQNNAIVHKVSTPCLDDHQFKEEELKFVGELSDACSQNFVKCLHLARIGRPDVLCQSTSLQVRSQSGPEHATNV